jgi:uncharacterized membrane protein YhiD involved in acid resistance
MLALGILTLLNRLERKLAASVYRTLTVTVSNDLREATEQRCREILAQQRMRVQQVTYRIDNTDGQARLLFSVRSDRERDTPDLVTEVAGQGGVATVEWS